MGPTRHPQLKPKTADRRWGQTGSGWVRCHTLKCLSRLNGTSGGGRAGAAGAHLANQGVMGGRDGGGQHASVQALGFNDQWRSVLSGLLSGEEADGGDGGAYD
ncbi:unnamed protein product [Arctogadus glacialis]